MHGKEIADPFRLLTQMEQRVRSIAQGLPRQAPSVAKWAGIGFRIQQLYFVLHLKGFVEVLGSPNITRLPRLKSWVLGIANVRGAIMPMIDLNGFLGFAPVASSSARMRTLIVQQDHIKCGLLVEYVLGLQQFSQDEECEASKCLVDMPDSCRPYVTGSFCQDEKIWYVFSADTLVKQSSFYQVALES